jgi:hypothetical protein
MLPYVRRYYSYISYISFVVVYILLYTIYYDYIRIYTAEPGLAQAYESGRMLTYADVCGRMQAYESAYLSARCFARYEFLTSASLSA